LTIERKHPNKRLLKSGGSFSKTSDLEVKFFGVGSKPVHGSNSPGQAASAST
jgi:hypothetical protein